MSTIALLIFAAIILSAFLNLYLDRRQAAAVLAHRGTVPAAFAETVTLEEHQRAADYTLARARVAVIETVYDTLLAILWLGVFLRPVFDFVAAHIVAGLTRSTATVVLVAALSYLLTLPFTIYKTFVLEARFGFNRTTPAIFALDQVKAAVLQLALGVPLLYG